MSVARPPTREALRSALHRCITGEGGAPLRARHDGTLLGEAFFGAPLAGPPGRLHGGLHAYARVVSVLRALRGEEALAEAFPLRCSLRLERPLLLETALHFEGTYREDAHGFALTTRFMDTPKLDAHAESAGPLGPDAVAPFRELVERTAHEPSRTLMIRDSFPVMAYTSGCIMTVDEAFLALPRNELAATVRVDGGLDAAFTCVALDWIGAIGMGVRWQARLYTTHLSLHLAVDRIPHEERLLVVVDCTRPEVDPEQPLDPVVLHGEPVRATSLPVALLSGDLQRAYATGRVTLLPLAGQTERLGAPLPAR
ncbi:MAG: hypothetical protein H6725_08740 [Sandaracinaceae bacterium]|nr:hypothetical protein [Sandaracinaceae bacterium]